MPEKENDEAMLPRSETVARHQQPPTQSDVILDCGWGRLIFAQTFADGEILLDELLQERQGRRDIAFYVDDPHVLLSLRPQQIFLDPSDTYRLDLDGELPQEPESPFVIRPLESAEDA
ncbi:MAG TPA: N-acetylglutaminylglutamine synthetase, partial [Kiloniellales bacterium]|nr:N-acetylglutaminylglutamine synthetase [Kiloniellales bacterium]